MGNGSVGFVVALLSAAVSGCVLICWVVLHGGFWLFTLFVLAVLFLAMEVIRLGEKYEKEGQSFLHR